MAETEAATSEPVVLAEQEAAEPTKATESQKQEEAAAEPSEPIETPSVAPDHKRKLDNLEPHEDEEAPVKKQEILPTEVAAESPVPLANDDEVRSDDTAQEIAVQMSSAATVVVDSKRARMDGETDGSAADEGQQVQKLQSPLVENGQHPSTENIQQNPAENLEKLNGVVSHQGSLPSAGQQPPFEIPTCSRKMEVPNKKIGVLIGKAGDTIKFLQYNSGAKIQITRDADADPYSTTRPVELIGTLENVNKAEQLIKDVLAEADSGGSPALVARGFVTTQSAAEQLEIRVPNEKVGIIIGKGGETIKNLQTRSGARIQLIPQHLPEGDTSKERTVRITGNKNHIETATEMIKEVMSRAPVRPSPLSGGYSQQTFRPRGSTAPPQWGPRALRPTQMTAGYDYHQQRGMYPPHTTQYPPQSYGGYSQPAPQSSTFSTGWDQRPVVPAQNPQTGGYDYYGQGGQVTDNQSSHSMPAPASAPSPAPAATPAPVNYNYGQSQAPYSGQPTYAQPIPTQQSYGHGYDEPKYDSQAPSQQIYGQQPVSSQPGVYPQGSAPQSGYTQQQSYSNPAYGVPQQDAAQSYGPPRASQPGDPMYQGSAPSSYGTSGSAQQPYPYGSSAPPQAAPAYGQTYCPTSGTTGGYTQPLAAGYAQPGGQATTGYGQAGQPVPVYTQQGSQSGGYGQYPTSQPSYGDQPVSNNASYGYQGGSADGGYGAPAPVSGQAGYVQPSPIPSGYEQSVPPQSGYGSVPGSVPVGYTKSLSPQPGYGGQYNSGQMYGHH